MDFCVYLTIYSGNKLPPFYIGYSTVKKVSEGYHGSVVSQRYKKIWRQELKDHPELFVTRILTTHFSKKEAQDREMDIQRKLNVIKNPLYINLSIYPHYGLPHTKETKQKIAITTQITWQKKISNGYVHHLKGRKQSSDHVAKRTAHRIGTKTDYKPRNIPMVECPHCYIRSRGVAIRKWHFDNCKMKETLSCLQP